MLARRGGLRFSLEGGGDVTRDRPARVDESPKFVPAVVDGSPESRKEDQRLVEATPLIGFDLDCASVWVCSSVKAA